MSYDTHSIKDNNPFHLKQKDGSMTTKVPPVILLFNRFLEIRIFGKLNLCMTIYDKGQVHQGTLKNLSFQFSRGRLSNP
jgi:hypothetical protein